MWHPLLSNPILHSYLSNSFCIALLSSVADMKFPLTVEAVLNNNFMNNKM